MEVFLIRGLLVYSATAYVFSGLICYLAFVRNLSQHCKSLQFDCKLKLLTSVWIIVLWPLWIIREIKKEDNTTEEISPTINVMEPAEVTHEQTSSNNAICNGCNKKP